MDLRPTSEHELLRQTVREFAEVEIRPNVRAWDEAQQFSADLMPKLAAVGLTGITAGGRVRRRRVVGARVLHRDGRAGAGRSVDRAVDRRAQRPLHGAPGHVWERRPEAAAAAAARAWRGHRGLGADRSQRRQRRRRHAHHGAPRRPALDPFRGQAVHHARRDRRHPRRHGGDGSCAGAPWHLGVRGVARDARAPGRQERRQARHARERHERSDLSGVPGSGRGAGRQRKARGS